MSHSTTQRSLASAVLTFIQDISVCGEAITKSIRPDQYIHFIDHMTDNVTGRLDNRCEHVDPAHHR